MFTKLLNRKGKGFRHLLANIFLEVMIIIIGVLLSLWISDGFQSRKEQRLEQEFLLQLQQDLLADQRILQDDRQQREGQLKAAQEVTQILGQELTPQELFHIAGATRRLLFTIRFSSTNPTFRSLESTGQLKLIRNDSLVNDLIRLYGISYQVLDENNDDVTAFRNNFLLPYAVEELDFRAAVNPTAISESTKLSKREQLFNMAVYLNISIQSTLEAYQHSESRVARILTRIERDLAQ